MERVTCTHRIGGYVDPRDQTICTLWRRKLAEKQTPVVQLVIILTELPQLPIINVRSSITLCISVYRYIFIKVFRCWNTIPCACASNTCYTRDLEEKLFGKFEFPNPRNEISHVVS
jgi:hypothetical protein